MSKSEIKGDKCELYAYMQNASGQNEESIWDECVIVIYFMGWHRLDYIFVY